MRETIDEGLGELRAREGKGGLPAEPAAAAGEATAAPFTRGAPPPEPNIATEIAEQALEADRAEADASQAAQPASDSVPAPLKLSLGMTQKEVTDILGQPKTVVAVSSTIRKLIYTDMTVTLESGRVTDIE